MIWTLNFWRLFGNYCKYYYIDSQNKLVKFRFVTFVLCVLPLYIWVFSSWEIWIWFSTTNNTLGEASSQRFIYFMPFSSEFCKTKSFKLLGLTNSYPRTCQYISKDHYQISDYVPFWILLCHGITQMVTFPGLQVTLTAKSFNFLNLCDASTCSSSLSFTLYPHFWWL